MVAIEEGSLVEQPSDSLAALDDQVGRVSGVEPFDLDAVVHPFGIESRQVLSRQRRRGAAQAGDEAVSSNSHINLFLMLDCSVAAVQRVSSFELSVG
jgi:hypothetical protein